MLIIRSSVTLIIYSYISTIIEYLPSLIFSKLCWWILTNNIAVVLIHSSDCCILWAYIVGLIIWAAHCLITTKISFYSFLHSFKWKILTATIFRTICNSLTFLRTHFVESHFWLSWRVVCMLVWLMMMSVHCIRLYIVSLIVATNSFRFSLITALATLWIIQVHSIHYIITSMT